VNGHVIYRSNDAGNEIDWRISVRQLRAALIFLRGGGDRSLEYCQKNQLSLSIRDKDADDDDDDDNDDAHLRHI